MSRLKLTNSPLQFDFNHTNKNLFDRFENRKKSDNFRTASHLKKTRSTKNFYTSGKCRFMTVVFENKLEFTCTDESQ